MKAQHFHNITDLVKQVFAACTAPTKQVPAGAAVSSKCFLSMQPLLQHGTTDARHKGGPSSLQPAGVCVTVKGSCWLCRAFTQIAASQCY